ncbi:toll/interleukin-1 receptor domain-containing protein [Acinetobacter baumannii]|uniref:toll/interleukin-1 receptor domain-containing protein n=1 Tax=Acinetobacter baumannii TaxID=470 RepID=UPI001BC8883C|nr:toll/interleukin-1 receptor domain-containing protein [Acinetobacter baumannii]
MNPEQYQQLLEKSFQETPITDKGFKSIEDVVFKTYQAVIKQKHPTYAHIWPVLSGHNRKTATLGQYYVLIYSHTGSSGMMHINGMGDISFLFPNQTVNESNFVASRQKIIGHFDLKKKDLIFFVKNDLSNLQAEILFNLKNQELCMNLQPIKIFLSHKSVNKPKVREFKKTLELLGFQPWLDEDAMHAGVELERALLTGMQDSCAAIFFITPDYVDENYLSSEITYAIQRKRADPNFAIIALNIEENGREGIIPMLLTPYVWKKPSSDLEALQEILKALPVKVGEVFFKQS